VRTRFSTNAIAVIKAAKKPRTQPSFHDSQKEIYHGRKKYHQFQVLLLAVKTGGFQTSFSGSMERLPLTFSFSFWRSRWATTASVRTMTC
jgi:hypothetical protein